MKLYTLEVKYTKQDDWSPEYSSHDLMEVTQEIEDTYSDAYAIRIESEPADIKAYYCTGFTGVLPTGTSAVVTAPDEAVARHLLNEELDSQGLPLVHDDFDMVEIDMGTAKAEILNDGDY